MHVKILNHFPNHPHPWIFKTKGYLHMCIMLKEKSILTAQKDDRTTKPQGFIKKQTAPGISSNADLSYEAGWFCFNSPATLSL